MDRRILLPCLLLIILPLAQAAPLALDADVPAAVLPSAPAAEAALPELPVDVEKALTCQTAFKLTDRYWGGIVHEEEQRTLAWTQPYSWTTLEVRSVPIVEQVEVPMLRDVPLIGGLAEGLQLTRMVERVVGHDWIVEVKEHIEPITIRLEMSATYVDWERQEESWYVSPVGVAEAFIGFYSMEPAQVCNGETVHLIETHHQRAAFDRYSNNAWQDGWTASVTDIDVHWASQHDLDTLPSRDEVHRDTALIPWQEVQEAIDHYAPLLPQDQGRPDDAADDVPDQTAPHDSSLHGGASGVKASTWGSALIASLLASLGGAFAWRRF